MGMSDWLINTISELHDYFRKGNASQVSSAVEEVTGKKPISFSNSPKIMQRLSDESNESLDALTTFFNENGREFDTIFQ